MIATMLTSAAPCFEVPHPFNVMSSEDRVGKAEESITRWCDGGGILDLSCRNLEEIDCGTSGVYLLRDDEGKVAGVFKPAEQEHIPEEFAGVVDQGENMYRERAAYVLSRELGGFCKVPTTVLATVRHPTLAGGEQRGSLQRFVADAVDMSDMGPDGLADEEVHRVGMLDLLLMNLDRHEGNMLVSRSVGGAGRCKEGTLVPIDHGLCLPRIASPSSCPDTYFLQQLAFAWQGWRQSTRPFGDAPKQLAMSLTHDAVGELAGRIVADTPGLSPQALTTLKIGAALVRVGVGAGLTLSDIASFVVSGGLSRALASAWEGGEEGAGYAEWEAGFIGRLEKSLSKIYHVDSAGEPSLGASARCSYQGEHKLQYEHDFQQPREGLKHRQDLQKSAISCTAWEEKLESCVMPLLEAEEAAVAPIQSDVSLVGAEEASTAYEMDESLPVSAVGLCVESYEEFAASHRSRCGRKEKEHKPRRRGRDGQRATTSRTCMSGFEQTLKRQPRHQHQYKQRRMRRNGSCSSCAAPCLVSSCSDDIGSRSRKTEQRKIRHGSIAGFSGPFSPSPSSSSSSSSLVASSASGSVFGSAAISVSWSRRRRSKSTGSSVFIFSARALNKYVA